MSVKRSVIRYDDTGHPLQRYASIKEAQAEYACTHISSVCRGRRMHDKGYVWRYEFPMPGDHLPPKRRKKTKPKETPFL